MEKFKTYLVEVVLKKITNAGAQNVVSALVVFLAAHQNYLESFGITTFTWGQWPNAVQPSGMCTLIEWDTLTVGGAASLMSVATMVFVWVQHHTNAAIKGEPQSGDLRKNEPTAVVGGDRKDDPK